MHVTRKEEKARIKGGRKKDILISTAESIVQEINKKRQNNQFRNVR